MRLSVVIFDSPISSEQAAGAELLGATTDTEIPLGEAYQADEGQAFGVVGGRAVFTAPAIFSSLTDWESRICTAAGAGGATLLSLDLELELFAIMRWENGAVVRQHVAFDGEYITNGAPLPIEAAILKNFTPERTEKGVSFVSSNGDRFDAGQIGDALVNAVMEQELGEPEVLLEASLMQCSAYEAEPDENAPWSEHGGVNLLKTLASKELLELNPDVNLRKLDVGMEPFLAAKGDSFKRADSLIEWLIEQPGVEEVYISTEHLAKLLARW